MIGLVGYIIISFFAALLFVLWSQEKLKRLKYEVVIRWIRDQRGDDRCWADLEQLYNLLPEGYTVPKRDTLIKLENCKKYIESCNNPATVYVSPEREIENLRRIIRRLHLNYCDIIDREPNDQWESSDQADLYNDIVNN